MSFHGDTNYIIGCILFFLILLYRSHAWVCIYGCNDCWKFLLFFMKQILSYDHNIYVRRTNQYPDDTEQARYHWFVSNRHNILATQVEGKFLVQSYAQRRIELIYRLLTRLLEYSISPSSSSLRVGLSSTAASKFVLSQCVNGKIHPSSHAVANRLYLVCVELPA